ncbi:hypothetical protein FRX31_023386 [Thalictrum thalictroides]|uniref:Uncharacterized protein n=1 Tax=Thalictrum thalictroides TaxID=46969 RepID=A0A7J6VQH8_THATH|nr:hypothetical protein FRX31_023386 [Thalictrum thalictroides]
MKFDGPKRGPVAAMERGRGQWAVGPSQMDSIGHPPLTLPPCSAEGETGLGVKISSKKGVLTKPLNKTDSPLPVLT